MAHRFNRFHQQTTRSNSVSSSRDNAANGSGGSGSNSKTGANTMKFVQKYLDECRSFYSCIYCRTHLANHDELISRSFQGNRSRAYLFNSVINVSCGPSVQRELNTGSHSVADIFCTNCGTTIGWKYEKAFVDSQRYKEGKFIIELAHVVRENRHLELDKRDIFLGLAQPAPHHQQQQQQQQPPTTQQTPSSPPSSSLLQPTATSAAASIGTNHRGSLSPASSSGQWSPGTSSSSSSNDEASTTGLSAANNRRQPNCRYLTSASSNQDDDDGLNDEIDDDEVLMFPFYDYLYGNRSSYSNLCTTRGHQKRLRRSLHLEAAAPYDWKYAGGGSASGASPTITTAATTTAATISTSLQAPKPDSSTSSNLFPCSSTSIGIPVVQADNNNSSSNNSSSNRQQLAVGRRFFATATPSVAGPSSCPESSFPQATSSMSLAMGGNGDMKKIKNNSEQAQRRVASSCSREVEFDVDDEDGDTQFRFEHDKQVEASPSSASASHREQTVGGRTGGQLMARDQQLQKQQQQQQDDNSTQKLEANIAHSTACSSAKTTNGTTLTVASAGVARATNPEAGGREGKQSSSATTHSAGSNAQASGMTNNDRNTASTTDSELAQSMRRTNSLSFDDEEFHDCNTDHDVSNSNSP